MLYALSPLWRAMHSRRTRINPNGPLSIKIHDAFVVDYQVFSCIVALENKSIGRRYPRQSTDIHTPETINLNYVRPTIDDDRILKRGLVTHRGRL
ncbi:hypothetical protein GCM10028796_04750 [Ramlibacter monticola]